MFNFFSKKEKEIEPKDDTSNLGCILKLTGAISEDSLAEILFWQKSYGEKKKIGEVALILGACSAEDIEYAIDIQNKLRNPKVSNLRLYVAMQRKNIDRSLVVQKKRSALNHSMMLKVG